MTSHAADDDILEHEADEPVSVADGSFRPADDAFGTRHTTESTVATVHGATRCGSFMTMTDLQPSPLLPPPPPPLLPPPPSLPPTPALPPHHYYLYDENGNHLRFPDGQLRTYFYRGLDETEVAHGHGYNNVQEYWTARERGRRD